MSDTLVCVKDYETYAYSVLPKNALDYYKSGAGSEETLAANRSAFSKFKIRPRCLKDISNLDITTTVLGEKLAMPIGIAPTAMQRMAHPQGEIANVKAAEAMGTVFILSTLSTTSLEDVAAAAPKCKKWFQLYICKDRSIPKSLINRAEAAGFKALVLTVDTPLFGLRLADIRNQFSLPPHLRLGNFNTDDSTRMNNQGEGSSLNNNLIANFFDSSLEWKDIKWLKSVTKLPIILKGILTAEDAVLAADAGVAGILVSNHGARQIDGTPATIEALPEIVKAVGDRLEVYLDGGVTTGNDAFKAIALGAKMVFIGRPALWALAHSGEEGVKKLLQIMKREFESALGLAGCSSIQNIGHNAVVPESFYSKM